MNAAISRILVGLVLVLFSAMSRADTYDATLAWDGVRVISIPVDGLVTHVDVEPGQRVAKGQSLLKLSQAARLFSLRKAEAAMQASAPALKDAEREKNDAEVLYEQTVLSDIELQDALIRYEEVKAKHSAAVAELDYQKWALGWTRVKSPIDAVVIESMVLPGQMIAGDERSRALMKLAAVSSMRAEAVIGAERLGDVNVGDAMKLQVGNRTYQASVVSLRRLVEKNAVDRVVLQLRFETDQVYYPGMKASVEHSG